MKRDRTSRLLIVAGVLMLLCAGAWVLRNHLLQQQAGEAARENLQVLIEQMPEPVSETAEGVESVTYLDLKILDAGQQVEIPDYLLDSNRDMPEEEVEGVPYIGYLELPVLDLKLPVCAETNDWYLQLAPCRFSGSAYLDTMVIGAHNYVTHFGSLGLMKYGDEVIFTDMDGNVFRYEVVDFESLLPNQAEDLTSGDWDLSLYTCTFNRQNRLVLRCDRIEYEE